MDRSTRLAIERALQPFADIAWRFHWHRDEEMAFKSCELNDEGERIDLLVGDLRAAEEALRRLRSRREWPAEFLEGARS